MIKRASDCRKSVIDMAKMKSPGGFLVFFTRMKAKITVLNDAYLYPDMNMEMGPIMYTLQEPAT